MDKQIKEILINKVQSALNNSSENERISIKDFSKIAYKKEGDFILFHHPTYKNVNIQINL